MRIIIHQIQTFSYQVFVRFHSNLYRINFLFFLFFEKIANLDDLANDLIASVNNNFLVDQENNLELLINNNDFSSILNQDNETLYECNHKLSDSTAQITNQIDPDYIHELLSDEDLQMIGFPNLRAPCLDEVGEASGISHLNDNLELTNEDRIEVSSDSAISSMSRSVSTSFDSNFGIF